MKNNRYVCLAKCSFILFLFGLLTAPAALAQDAAKEPRTPQERAYLERMKAAAASMDTSLTMFGMVLDQFDHPVPGARIEIGITRSTSADEILEVAVRVVASDETGRFEDVGERGVRMSVQRIVKQGYEYVYDGKTMIPISNRNPRTFVADKERPDIYRVRLRGETTFVVSTHDFPIMAEPLEIGIFKGFDFIHGSGIKDLKNPVVNNEPLVCDLKYTAVSSSDGTSWTVALASGDPDGGIIASDQLLYEAPADGYQPSYMFNPEDHKAPDKPYLYIKSRNPSIYTRVILTNRTNAEKKWMRLDSSAVTNPYGERNFELEPDIPGALWPILEEEIRRAFRNNERPSKPDLQALIQQAKLDHPPKPTPVPAPIGSLTRIIETHTVGP